MPRAGLILLLHLDHLLALTSLHQTTAPVVVIVGGGRRVLLRDDDSVLGRSLHRLTASLPELTVGARLVVPILVLSS